MRNYYPSNGTEGSVFMEVYCEKCYKYNQCTILTNSLAGKQPKQWIYNDEGEPVCTSFNPDRPKSKKVKKTNEPTLF